ncbi:MAG TPA: hypothetical protein VEQ60_27110 [Longimicrobium sp.]|nr:hypothetical protein [Longimicrobium sp.]
MSRLLSMLAALALSAGAAQPAAAAPAPADDDALGVVQQGKGQGGGQGGGGQEARESRGRGQGGGGQEARESRGRSGGGSDARPSRQSGQGQSARGSGQSSERRGGSSGGNSGSARSDDRGRSSDDARGGSSDDARGSRGNSASARGDDRASNSGNSANASSGRGNSGASADRLPSVRSRGRLSANDLQSRITALPPAQRRLANSARASERMAVGAIARGHARGLAADAFGVRSDNDRVRILNRRGDLLFDLDDRRASQLGGWQMRRLGDQAPRANAPAFCRSGEGHPVWGREWCIEKGFGLGSRSGTIWSRGGIGDVIFRNPDTRTRLDRGGLLGVLGDIVLGRLALQAVSLGYDQPLTGYWVAEPEGPRILRVRSGDYEVAEFYDRDRNDRVEVLYVVQPVW